MGQYKVCEFCGSHLDFGEKCDCQKNTEEPKEPQNPKNDGRAA